MKMWSIMQIAWVFSNILAFKRLGFVDATWQIVNGTSCDIQNRPYFIGLSKKFVDKNGTLIRIGGCGGSLIKPNVVLTAAHCCSSIDEYPLFIPTIFYAYSSPTKMGDDPEFEQVRESREYKVHPKYNHTRPSYDLCLIKLIEGFHVTERTQLVKLAPSTSFKPITEGHKLIEVIGYGRVWSSSMSGPISNINATLQCTENVALGTDGCREYFKSIGRTDLFFSASSFCTLPGFTRSTPCLGDSGGPVMYNGTQVGLVSYGISFCGPEPVVFARVDSELQFIIGLESSVHRMLVSPTLYIFILFVNIF